MKDQLLPNAEWLAIIAASGIVGTAAMTLFMYGMTFITDKVMKVTKILGTMITCQTTDDRGLSESKTAIFTGIVAHYIIGIAFVFCYHILWFLGVGQPDFLNGLILGLASGMIAVMFWFTFFAVHPFPPDVDLKSYLLTLFLAHFVFALTAVWAYVFFAARL
ncbi:hypothetical protein [Dyadobacter fanqingshengii]|uniref:Uncharacterized protein n=1 Tax=Dyadobacter fanqingshengii TaxID=2906443 RepID=A0A9X1PAP7_9BACT|nr:hypothetical protein [Dyadobacter fanqingshengii]MCF0040178.1 hypothetical protein [Dyadobacter fanqingshengii]USJ38071.1 hypothetical protein NFI81_09845 [Dyadobacter fanqingshengii]